MEYTITIDSEETDVTSRIIKVKTPPFRTYDYAYLTLDGTGFSCGIYTLQGIEDFFGHLELKNAKIEEIEEMFLNALKTIKKQECVSMLLISFREKCLKPKHLEIVNKYFKTFTEDFKNTNSGNMINLMGCHIPTCDLLN